MVLFLGLLFAIPDFFRHSFDSNLLMYCKLSGSFQGHFFNTVFIYPAQNPASAMLLRVNFRNHVSVVQTQQHLPVWQTTRVRYHFLNMTITITQWPKCIFTNSKGSNKNPRVGLWPCSSRLVYRNPEPSLHQMSVTLHHNDLSSHCAAEGRCETPAMQ